MSYHVLHLLGEDVLLGPANANSPQYVLKSPSDKGCVAWRKWWYQHMAHIPAFGPQLDVPLSSKALQRDYFEMHAKHCRHCLQAWQRASSLLSLLPILGLFGVILSRNTWQRVGVVALTALVNKVCNVVMRMTAGPKVTERISAAQFPEKQPNNQIVGFKVNNV
jgi:hypothetical protein